MIYVQLLPRAEQTSKLQIAGIFFTGTAAFVGLLYSAALFALRLLSRSFYPSLAAALMTYNSVAPHLGRTRVSAGYSDDSGRENYFR